MKDRVTKVFTNVGFLALSLCAICYVSFFAWGLYGVFSEGMPLMFKGIIIFGIAGGGILFFVVVRERLIERKTDRYKDVEL
ncbi:MAG: hypothetical protein F4W92_06340 [Gammaproteobacteria bacterium]|nr:hypothetical protein [Gammaproteobacteria bacterium]